MLETSRIPGHAGWALAGLLAAGCAAAPATVEVQSVTPVAVAAPPVVPAAVADEVNLAEEAKALLAQAETDVQRARAKRALWQRAWEDLLASRQAFAANDSARAIRHAKRASEFAQLGLEQLAYPAVK